MSDAQERALDSLALSWLQVVERQYVKVEAGQRPPYIRRQDTVPAAQLLSHAPNGQWFERLRPEQSVRVLIALTHVLTDLGRAETVLENITTIAASNRPRALELAEDYLRSWAKIKRRGDDASFTPEAQAESKAVLFKSLSVFQELFEEPLDSAAVMLAFGKCHTMEQIYIRDDFDKLLSLLDGPIGVIVTNASEIMGQRLRVQWEEFDSSSAEDPDLAELEMFEAVREGYALIDDKLKMVLEKHPDSSRHAATLGALRLDAADFYLKQKGAIEPRENRGESVLRSFKIQRDTALEALGLATESYAKAVPTLARAEYSPRVFSHRFEAIMRMTEVAMASLPAKLRGEELCSLRDDMLALKGHVAEGHVETFVKWFGGAYKGLEPKDRYRYLSSVASVLGDNPAGASFKRDQKRYDEWLSEIGLHVEVDGDRYVGNDREFGVFITFRHTEAIGHDSDPGYYLRMPEYLNQFRYNIQQALREIFYVRDIVFHQPGARPCSYGRAGWQETPLAYVVLCAKDPGVDRIPPIELNLEYPPPADIVRSDGRVLRKVTAATASSQTAFLWNRVYDDERKRILERSILLPVSSQVATICSYPERRNERPYRDVTVIQTFDDRSSAKGKIRLDVTAKGKGLLPELDDLLLIGLDRHGIPGFEILEIQERGAQVDSLDSSGSLAAVCTRKWTVELALDDMNRDKAKTFHFPEAKAKDIEMVHRRYEGADLVTCKPAIALGWIPPNIYRNARDVFLGAVALALLLVCVRLTKKCLSRPVEEEEYCLPDEITPFTVATLIRRISHDGRIRLSGHRCRELERDVSAVERSYFIPAPEKGGLDLRSIAQRWLKIAREEDFRNGESNAMELCRSNISCAKEVTDDI